MEKEKDWKTNDRRDHIMRLMRLNGSSDNMKEQWKWWKDLIKKERGSITSIVKIGRWDYILYSGACVLINSRKPEVYYIPPFLFHWENVINISEGKKKGYIKFKCLDEVYYHFPHRLIMKLCILLEKAKKKNIKLEDYSSFYEIFKQDGNGSRRIESFIKMFKKAITDTSTGRSRKRVSYETSKFIKKRNIYVEEKKTQKGISILNSLSGIPRIARMMSQKDKIREWENIRRDIEQGNIKGIVSESTGYICVIPLDEYLGGDYDRYIIILHNEYPELYFVPNFLFDESEINEIHISDFNKSIESFTIEFITEGGTHRYDLEDVFSLCNLNQGLTLQEIRIGGYEHFKSIKVRNSNKGKIREVIRILRRIKGEETIRKVEKWKRVKYYIKSGFSYAKHDLMIESFKRRIERNGKLTKKGIRMNKYIYQLSGNRSILFKDDLSEIHFIPLFIFDGQGIKKMYESKVEGKIVFEDWMGKKHYYYHKDILELCELVKKVREKKIRVDLNDLFNSIKRNDPGNNIKEYIKILKRWEYEGVEEEEEESEEEMSESNYESEEDINY